MYSIKKALVAQASGTFRPRPLAVISAQVVALSEGSVALLHQVASSISEYIDCHSPCHVCLHSIVWVCTTL